MTVQILIDEINPFYEKEKERKGGDIESSVKFLKNSARRLDLDIKKIEKLSNLVLLNPNDFD